MAESEHQTSIRVRDTQQTSLKTELKGRSLWYDGDSTVSEQEILSRIASGDSTAGLFVDVITPALEQFNQLVPEPEKVCIKTSVRQLTQDWVLPEPYASLDVKDYVYSKAFDYAERNGTPAKGVFHRVTIEFYLYEKYRLFNLLRCLIFIINTLEAHNAVWGVGRGSSVSSFVLYLIGVHDVDSIKYDLDVTDFLHD